MNEIGLEIPKRKLLTEKEIKVDDIPICSSCLIEIRIGSYLCSDCKMNLCEQDVISHSEKKHKIFSLIKKQTIID